MKIKPNIEHFSITKDPTDFLEGGAIDVFEGKEKKNTVQSDKASIEKKVHREQKVFRLSLEIINALKRESYEQSIKAGSRVTETELVEQALRAYLSI